MSTANFFGWSLLYKSVAHEIKSKQDLLICLTHYALITQGFECIGIGDSQNMDGNESRSEALPPGWNDNYRVRYVYQGRLYLLQGTVLDDGIMLNLIRPEERTVAMVQFSDQIVARQTGNIEEMIPGYRDVVQHIKDELIDKVTSSTKKKDNVAQTDQVGVTPRASRSESSTHPYHQFHAMYEPFGRCIGVGRSDLEPLGGIIPMAPIVPRGGGCFNPLGGGGGGMLFQPQRFHPPRHGLPPGAVPPGARFDPFAPQRAPRPPQMRPHRPDNDDLLPPDFDDMYM